MMGGYAFGGMLFGGLMMVVFSVLVIAGIIWLIVTLARGGQTNIGMSPAGQTPLDILKARYAKGEITKEQFDSMKHDLGG